MSKGMGWLQRAALKALTENKSLTVLEVAWYCFDVQPNEAGRVGITASQRAATARALLGLQKKGFAFAVHRTHGGHFLWSLRDNALASVDRVVRAFGNSGASCYGRPLLDTWANRIG